MQYLLNDISYAIRVLVKSPGYTIILLLTIALGIGANSAIFTIINSVLLRPLPYNNPDKLVIISNDFSKDGQTQKLMSFIELDDLVQRVKSFENISGWASFPTNLTGVYQPLRITAIGSTINYFSVLGVKPIIGRTFQPGDYRTGYSSVVIISYRLWQNNFDSSPNISGKALTLDNDSYQIVGVMPPGFQPPGVSSGVEVDVWAAAGFKTEPFSPPVRSDRQLNLIARLKPEKDINAAKAEMNVLASQLKRDYPDEYGSGWNIDVALLHDSMVSNARRAMLILMGAVFLVLLIACTNVASLNLVRAAIRQKEMAIRASIGATPIKLFRQLICESMLLTLLGGGLGYLLAFYGLKLLFVMSPPNLPRMTEITPDGRVILFTFVLSTATGIVLSLLPVFEALRTDVVSVLKEGSGRGSTGIVQRHYLRIIFVTSQFILSTVLLIGAGLLMKSFWRLYNVDPGFNPNNLLVISLALPSPNQAEIGKYFKGNSRRAFYDQIMQRVGGLSGVKSVGMTSDLPLSVTDVGKVETPIFITGREYRSTQDQTHAVISSVSYNYFSSMGVPLVKGRYFTKYDTNKSKLVVIINEAMARYWPNGDALGKGIKFQKDGDEFEVAGIVKNVRSSGLDSAPPPETYYSYLQGPPFDLTLVVRTDSDAKVMAQAVQKEIRAVDSDQPIYNVKLMSDIISVSIQQRRFSALLLCVFAASALILASIGIYGVIAYYLVQKQQDFAIRSVIGANKFQLLMLVFKQGMLISIIGIAIGLGASFAFSRILAGMLFNVSVYDPIIFLLAPTLLAIVAFLGCYIPAHKKVEKDPAHILKHY